MKLTKTGLNVTAVEDADAAREALKDANFSLLIVDVGVSDDAGMSLIKSLRAESFDRPIIAVSADDASQVRQPAQDAGATAYVDKPIDLAELTDQISQCLDASGAPILSSMRSDADMLPLIESFVQQAGHFAEQLEQAINDNDLAAAAVTAKQLKGSGSSYGFDLLTEVAQRTLESVSQNAADADAAAESVRELVGVVRRLAS